MIKREQETSSTSPRQTFPDLPDMNLERVAGFNVYDKNNERIGKANAIWTDHTGQPAFLGVRTSWLFGKTHIVPAYGAKANQQDEAIRLPYSKADVENAPNYEPDAPLDLNKEREVMDYYRGRGAGLPEFDEGAQRTEDRGVETARDRGTAREATAEETRIPLHEENLKVGKREVETGGVRLRKIVRTETVQQPVELKHEELEVERVPAGQQTTGQRVEFKDEELFIPLRREEPVLEKETRVREEVRARKTATTERQNVSGEVRREDVEIEKQQEQQQHRTE